MHLQNSHGPTKNFSCCHYVKICYFKQPQHFTLHVRLMTTGNKDKYIMALTRNSLKNIAIDLWTMTSCNFMVFQSLYYSYLFPLQCKAEMTLDRLLLKKIIQETNTFFFDNDIKYPLCLLFEIYTFWDLINPFWDPFLILYQGVNLPLPNNFNMCFPKSNIIQECACVLRAYMCYIS